MIVEVTEYELVHAERDGFLKDTAKVHFEAQAKHLPLVGAFTSGSGPRGRLIYLAAYEDYDKREGQLLGLEADPSWQSVQREASSTIVETATTILNPTAFSPIRTNADFDQAIARRDPSAPGWIFELRTYTAIPGKMPNVLKMLVEEGNPLTHQFVEWPVAYFLAETGLANRVMMLWAYSSLSERARRKTKMLPDPRFQELGSRFNPNFSAQQSDFWIPTGFSPLR
jgi:NIPSNAP